MSFAPACAVHEPDDLLALVHLERCRGTRRAGAPSRRRARRSSRFDVLERLAGQRAPLAGQQAALGIVENSCPPSISEAWIEPAPEQRVRLVREEARGRARRARRGRGPSARSRPRRGRGGSRGRRGRGSRSRSPRSPCARSRRPARWARRRRPRRSGGRMRPAPRCRGCDLLVGHRRDDHVAAQAAPLRLGRDDQNRREAALHVVGAAAVQAAVLHVRVEGRLHRVDADRVHMGVQEQRAAAAEPRAVAITFGRPGAASSIAASRPARSPHRRRTARSRPPRPRRG